MNPCLKDNVSLSTTPSFIAFVILAQVRRLISKPVEISNTNVALQVRSTLKSLI
jgi:hypothetical protein